MRRAAALAAVIAIVASAGPASAASLTVPAWARPLITPLAQRMGRSQARVVPPLAPGPPAPSLRGFTCYVDAIGSAIALGAGSPCDRPAVALPILGP
jgi:hypothetical protein